MGSVMGLDSLASPVDDDDDYEEDSDSRSACSPFTQRTSTPILKRISKTYNNLLDSRRVAPSSQIKKTPVLTSSTRFSKTSTENSCGECQKKLSGKTVRLPDTQIRYHWKCLKCKGCALPFEDTSFFIDVHKRVFHPNVSLFKWGGGSYVFFLMLPFFYSVLRLLWQFKVVLDVLNLYLIAI